MTLSKLEVALSQLFRKLKRRIMSCRPTTDLEKQFRIDLHA